ncbi:MAG TPA: MmgE/PrpD family protein [Thermohalobaculum sp.]|nr:MmgE/PrpD family protein [Thermohalobaculum sp.]
MDGVAQTEKQVAAGVAALAEWAAALEWADVPGPIRSRAALVLCDDLAAIVAARNEPELIAFQNGLARSSGAAEATVFSGRGLRLDRYSAAVANGGASDWCELDEGYRRAIGHAGIYCLPALMAEAEAESNSGTELLRALVVGYEVVARVALCFSWDSLTLHPHGSLAAVGAAAAIAALRRLPAVELAAAINSAATMVVPGPYNHAVAGAMVRNVWPGVGAWAGMRAVDWVGAGITGRPEGLHDVYARAFGGNCAPQALTADLDREWGLADGYHKIHACCQYAHSAVEATLELLAQASAGEIARIHIDTHWRGRTLDNADPATTLAAKFSMQHILATTAVHGTAGAEAFHASTLTDPAVAALRRRVSIGSWEPEPEWPNDRPARIAWELADGRRLVAECLSARGGPDRPFSAPEIAAKALGIVAAPYPAMGAELKRLLALDAAALERPWGGTVRAMTG